MFAFLVMAALMFGGATYDQCASDELLAQNWDGFKAAMEDGKSRFNPDASKRCE